MTWTLAIDFGTSFTVAAIKEDGRPPQTIELSGDRRMPTVVHIDDDGSVYVGRVADDLASARPGQTLRAPKRRLGDPAPVVLGGRPYQVVDLVASVLRHVLDEAVRHEGSPPVAVRLTHPATWSRPRLARLLEAAAKAGLPDPMLIAEPVAAALSYAAEVAVPDGSYVAVYDLGGGTFDTTVLRAEGGTFTVVGRPGGDANLGGELFDELLVNMIGERLDPEVWEQLQVADDLAWRQAAAALRAETRRAKEALTAAPYAELLLPLPRGLVNQRVTRDELDGIVLPYVEESVRLLLQCVRDADVDPNALTAVYLVGGASRMPIIDRVLTAALGDVPVSRRGDPKTAVALGATWAQPSGSILDLQAAGGRVTLESNPGPVGPSGAPAPPTGLVPPATAALPSPPPPAASSPPPAATVVESGATVVESGATVVGSGATVVEPLRSPGPLGSPAAPPVAPAPHTGTPSRPGRSRTPVLVGAAAALALIVGVIAVLATRGGSGKTAAVSTTTAATPVTAASGPGIGSLGTTGSTTPATSPTTSPATSPVTSPATSAAGTPSTAPAPPVTAATLDPVADALTASEVDRTVLTATEVNEQSATTEWTAAGYSAGSTPFCGVDAPAAAIESHSVVSRGSGLDLVQVETDAYTYATTDDLVLNFEAVVKSANECPVPTMVVNGVTFTITPRPPQISEIPLIDHSLAFTYAAQAPGFPTINALNGIVTRGRSAALLQYAVIGRSLNQDDIATATTLLTLLATKLIAGFS